MTYWNADENMRYVPPTNVRFKRLEWLCLNDFWYLNVVKQSETIPVNCQKCSGAGNRTPTPIGGFMALGLPTNMMTRQ